MADYNVNPGIDWGKVIQMLQWERGVQADRRDQAEQAIRWQGEQDYKTLVDSGVDPMVAFGRTASRIFHNKPEGFARAAELLGKPPQATSATLGGREGIMQPGGNFTPFPMPVPKAEIRPYSRYNEVTGVRQTFTEQEWAKQQREDAITSELDIYNKAAAPGWWTGNPSDPNQMTISSNRLAQAGVNAQKALQLEAESQINAGNDGLFGGYKRQLRDARAKLAGLGVEVGDGVTAPAAITPPTATTRPWPNPFGNMLLSRPPVPSMSSQPTATGIVGPVAPVATNAPSVPAKTWRRPDMPAIEFLLKNPSTASDFDRKYGPGAARTFLKPFGK
jgi:hypothetical protein